MNFLNSEQRREAKLVRQFGRDWNNSQRLNIQIKEIKELEMTAEELLNDL